MTTERVSRYIAPQRWIHYDDTAIFNRLVAAKTAAGVLQEERAGDVEVRIEKPDAAALDA